MYQKIRTDLNLRLQNILKKDLKLKYVVLYVSIQRTCLYSQWCPYWNL